LADVGHPRAKNNPDTWLSLNQQAWQWLQSNINGSNDQQTNIASQETVCESGSAHEDPNDPNQNITATTPEALSNGKLSVAYAGGGTTDSATPDPNGAADDPVTNAIASQITPQAGNCPRSPGPSQYTAVSKPLAKDQIFVGLGSVSVPYTVNPPAAPTAQLDARVWDIPPRSQYAAGSSQCTTSQPPPGCPVLITRGTYRLDVLGGYDSPAGDIRIPLFGNQYKFQVGHQIRLDLTQRDDVPPDHGYLRPSNVQSAITINGKTNLTLPTRDSGTTTLTGAALP
jgi:hypothetical protein